MTFDERYRRQVALLIRLLPIVAGERDFALKGGTAINLFEVDMPRLSVDIDLVYLGLEKRELALAAVRRRLESIASEIRRQLPGTRVDTSFHKADELRLLVRAGQEQVKIECSPVLRGTVEKPQRRETRPGVQETFGFAEVRCVHPVDLYGGKICAALDRQHPRDLFDVRHMLVRGMLTRNVFDGFLVYLMSSPRPMSELLAPNMLDLSPSFNGEFIGMTATGVTLEALEQARSDLINTIAGFMTPDDRDFLIGFKRGEPDWQAFRYPQASELPAVRWKLLNLERMSTDKRAAAERRLTDVLDKMLA